MVVTDIDNWPTRDFSSQSSSPRFSSGDGVGTVRCFRVRIYEDTRVENDEYFTVSLYSRSRTCVIQGIHTATIVILDNDGEKIAKHRYTYYYYYYY